MGQLCPNSARTWMQQYVARSTKNVIFIAHTKSDINESEMVMETYVPIKGALKGVGLESFFSIVIASKSAAEDLEGLQQPDAEYHPGRRGTGLQVRLPNQADQGYCFRTSAAPWVSSIIKRLTWTTTCRWFSTACTSITTDPPTP